MQSFLRFWIKLHAMTCFVIYFSKSFQPSSPCGFKGYGMRVVSSFAQNHAIEIERRSFAPNYHRTFTKGAPSASASQSASASTSTTAYIYNPSHCFTVAQMSRTRSQAIFTAALFSRVCDCLAITRNCMKARS